MAEYIDREQALMQLTGRFSEDMSLEKYISLVNTRMNKLSPADVIERSKIDKAIAELVRDERIDEDTFKIVLKIIQRNI